VSNNRLESKVCPRCNKIYSYYPALSRRDNKTKICPDCGTDEAMFDLKISILKSENAAVEVINELSENEGKWIKNKEEKKL